MCDWLQSDVWVYRWGEGPGEAEEGPGLTAADWRRMNEPDWLRKTISGSIKHSSSPPFLVTTCVKGDCERLLEAIFVSKTDCRGDESSFLARFSPLQRVGELEMKEDILAVVSEDKVREPSMIIMQFPCRYFEKPSWWLLHHKNDDNNTKRCSDSTVESPEKTKKIQKKKRKMARLISTACIFTLDSVIKSLISSDVVLKCSSIKSTLLAMSFSTWSSI